MDIMEIWETIQGWILGFISKNHSIGLIVVLVLGFFLLLKFYGYKVKHSAYYHDGKGGRHVHPFILLVLICWGILLAGYALYFYRVFTDERYQPLSI